MPDKECPVEQACVGLQRITRSAARPVPLATSAEDFDAKRGRKRKPRAARDATRSPADRAGSLSPSFLRRIEFGVNVSNDLENVLDILRRIAAAELLLHDQGGVRHGDDRVLRILVELSDPRDEHVG